MVYPQTKPKAGFAIRVRPLYMEELDTALSLIHHSIRVLNAKDYSSQQIETIVRTYNRSFLIGNGVLVAEHRSQLVGVAKAGFSFWGTQSINAVFTHPAFVHKGVGRALVAELERRALLRSVKKLSVTASLTAVSFYEALHYKRVCKIDSVGNIPCILMEKQLIPLTFVDHLSRIVFLCLGIIVIFVVLYGLVYWGGYFLIYGL